MKKSLHKHSLLKRNLLKRSLLKRSLHKHSLKCFRVLFLTLLLILFSCQEMPKLNFSGDDGVIRNITTAALIHQMGLGINLGNTFEATGSWISPTVAAHETAWGSPIITKQMIQGYKNAGFKTLRIPVAWSNLMEMSAYTINSDLLNRIQVIVNWTREADMYAIVNLHWDGGWIENFPANYNECMKRYTRIWEQVAERFKNYGDYLLFESQNEELGFDSLWNKWGGTGTANMEGKTKAYEIVNAINQKFVDVIRASGGNNPYRHLLIAGYHTNIDNTCDQLFKMPDDPVNRMAVKVHYYDPFGFTHLEKDESWGTATWTWGTNTERSQLNNELNKMVTNFINKGIPVAIGEYGIAKKDLSEAEIRNYTLAVTEAMYIRGMLPLLWDVQLNDQPNYYYNRRIQKMTDSALETGMKKIAASR